MKKFILGAAIGLLAGVLGTFLLVTRPTPAAACPETPVATAPAKPPPADSDTSTAPPTEQQVKDAHFSMEGYAKQKPYKRTLKAMP